MKLSNRAKNIAQSEIRAMSILCNEKKGLNMAQGLCDLEVPLPVVQGAKEGIDSGKNTYTSAYGNYKLRAAIAKKQNDFYDQGVKVDNVLVSLGATGAFYATAMSLLNEGDEVILSTDKGKMIRCEVKGIRIAGRNTQGVRIFRLSGDEKVVSAIKIEESFI